MFPCDWKGDATFDVMGTLVRLPIATSVTDTSSGAPIKSFAQELTFSDHMKLSVKRKKERRVLKD